MPASAPCLVTSARSTSRWVEPQPSLMFSPSGSAPIAITSAPACRSIRGANSAAAPCAQSTTTVSPASGAAGSPSAPGHAGTRGQQVVECTGPVPVAASVTRPKPAGRSLRRRRGGMPMCASISSSTASGSLKPPRAEQLDPVVRRRVVAGRQHHAELGVEIAGQERDRRAWGSRRAGARPPRTRPARPPRRPRGTHRRPAGRGRPRPAGAARLPPWPRRTPPSRAARWRRPGPRPGQLAGQILASYATNTVSSEQPGHY